METLPRVTGPPTRRLEEMTEEARRKLAEARITEPELTEIPSEAPDEFYETLSRISKHSGQTASQRVSDRVNDVNSEPPQAVPTESNTIAESSNPPVATTISTIKVVQRGFPDQLAALTSRVNNSSISQKPNVAAVDFHMTVRANRAVLLHLPRSINCLSRICRLQSPHHTHHCALYISDPIRASANAAVRKAKDKAFTA